MFDHVPEQRERWLRVSASLCSTFSLSEAKFVHRITSLVCPHQSYLFT